MKFMGEQQAFELIVEYLKRNGADIQHLREDIKECSREIHDVKLQINKLESHDALMFDPAELKKIRSQATKVSVGAGAGVAGIVIAIIEFVKGHFLGG